MLLRLFSDIKLNAKAVKLVAVTSKHVFPIYLIHEHQIIRSLLWSTGILGILKATNSITFVAIILGGSIGIFLLGLIIDICIDRFFSLIDKLPQFRRLHTFLDKKCGEWIYKNGK